ncbi:hypothetical protein ECEPECA14_4718 [Escherichia coli EPECa14]|uniref:Uncharacterized protein n=1 Tax=Escherichia coli 3.4880 TaxID=1051347 RepID=A0AAV3I583_ECOLX|nr:hypothetical protein FORC28_4471 [Escherichia coli]EFZ39714.1 hypothetical protein ECEPECA14_4718 [Escherichia coli EPECa14]EHW30615.1 hypothetical protein ECDEC8D_0861 [Escherichia coli DEC8D]EHW56401.1 hypothetical protein ECDEC9D_0552 [Escherichia coli DEC9D]EHW68721.1 hypothetical protein ECDEC10A_0695 [Escherichia coli DEC10A]EHW83278.1 hypothetical protein ECDEC10D_0637 [Escherichia coli DEC10D]EHX00498.1 hypothetical protein ECDEC10F_1086 [Escherichia coli DEC10F]EIN22754.1 hypothe
MLAEYSIKVETGRKNIGDYFAAFGTGTTMIISMIAFSSHKNESC